MLPGKTKNNQVQTFSIVGLVLKYCIIYISDNNYGSIYSPALQFNSTVPTKMWNYRRHFF